MKETQTFALTPPADSGNNTSMLVNVGGTLALILLFIIGIAWVARRAGFTPQSIKGNKRLSVLETHSLGQRERAVLVELEGKWLLLGVTANSVNCLTTLDKPFDTEETAHQPAKSEFQAALMMNILKKYKTGSAK